MRELNTRLYVVAAVITIGVFLFGMLFGIVVEGKRVGYIDEQARLQRLDFSSLQLQFEYINQIGKENCPALTSAMDEYFNRLAVTEERLTKYQKDADFDKSEFNLLKREYIQAEMSYWMLVNRIKESCPKNIVTALYFYSDDEQCPECGDQAFVLGYLKDLFKDKLLVFSIDTQLDESLVNLARSSFDITKYPTVVIDSRVFSGFTDKDTIFKAVCAEFDETVEECRS